MKKYNVENSFRNNDQIAGAEPYDFNLKDNYIGDYIEAEDAAEAIDLAMQYIIDHIEQAELEEQAEDSLMFRSIATGELFEYCGFAAKEVE